jgi:hypothetical protein
MMMKNFRLAILAFLSMVVLFSCLKRTSKKELEDNLKTTMGLYLNHQPQIDTSRVHFEVLDVSFFEEKTDYLCEFKVNMKEKNNNQIKDTTGTMSAAISKDLKVVTRKF